MKLAPLPIVFLLFAAACAPSPSQTPPGQGPAPRTASPLSSAPLPADLVRPEDLAYLGAFRLPDSGARPVVHVWQAQ